MEALICGSLDAVLLFITQHLHPHRREDNIVLRDRGVSRQQVQTLQSLSALKDDLLGLPAGWLWTSFSLGVSYYSSCNLELIITYLVVMRIKFNYRCQRLRALGTVSALKNMLNIFIPPKLHSGR